MSEIGLPRQETLEIMRSTVDKAAEIVSGEAGADPLKVFPDPKQKERRADVNFDKTLSLDQTDAFRGVMLDLGPGREESIGASEAGLAEGYGAVLEGGQAHKMMAELDLVLSDEIQPSFILITGAGPDGRPIPDGEKDLTAGLLDIEVDGVGDNEFEIAKQVIRNHPLFEPFPPGARDNLSGRADPSDPDAESAPEEMEMGTAYDLSQDADRHSLGPVRPGETSGQFVQLGTMAGGKPVIAMRVDRFPDPSGELDYVQPQNWQKITFATQFRSAMTARNYGFDAYNTIALVTSSTYEPSCKLDALIAQERLEGRIGAHILTYGMDLLAKIKDEKETKPPALNQLAATAFKTAERLKTFE